MIKKIYFECKSSSTVEAYPIVLLNGWGMNNDVWQSFIPELQTLSSVWVLDIDYTNDLDVLCSEIHQHLPEKSVLLGWSLGGMLATRLAAKYPSSVSALITLASNAIFVADDTWPEAMPIETFESFYQSLLKHSLNTRQHFLRLMVQGDEYRRDQKIYLAQTLKKETDIDNVVDNIEHYIKSDAHWVQGLDLLREIDNRLLLPIIDCPVLQIFGENDTLVPVAAVKKIIALNTQHHIHCLQNTGHLLHTPAARLRPIISQFLSEPLHA